MESESKLQRQQQRPPDGDTIGFKCGARSLTVLVRGSELFTVEMCGFGCSDCKPFQNEPHQLIKVDELFPTHRNKILSEKFLLVKSSLSNCGEELKEHLFL